MAAAEGSRDLAADRLVGAVARFSPPLIYQPPAMFFWVFLASRSRRRTARTRERSLRSCGSTFSSAGAPSPLGYLVAKAGAHFFADEATAGAREHLTHDVLGKSRWFVEQPLYRALNLFDLTASRWVAGLVALVAAGGMLLWIVRRAARPIMFAAVGADTGPALVPAEPRRTENWAAYRTQVSIDALIALYACLGTLALLVTVRTGSRRR